MRGKKKKTFQIYGKHLTIDAYGISRRKLASHEEVFRLLNDLPGMLGMHKLTTPYVVFDDWQMGRAKADWGVSGFVMIYESHISCHTWPEIGYVSMDVYSCRPFDHKKTIIFLKKFWKCRRMIVRVVKRG